MAASAKTDKLLAAIDTAEATTYSSDNSGILSRQRSKSIGAYLGESTIGVEDGLSQQVSKDIFDVVESIKPSLMRIFSGDDSLCKFVAVGAEDEAAAEQESDYVNYIITQRNPWYQICNDWFTDALLTKNAYAMAWWDTTRATESVLYEDQSQDQLALQYQDPEADIVEVTPKQDEQTGEPMYDFRVRYSKEKGRLCIKVLPPERTKVSEHTPDFTLGECPYFEYWENVTISSIRAMGFKIDDEISDTTGNRSATQEDTARNQFFETATDKDTLSDDPSMRLVRLRMIWIRYDYDGDGIAEMQYCLVVGNKLLFRDECNRIPVASIVPIPLPHRHPGLSIADVAMDIQDIKTMVLRQGIDNLFHANNIRTAVSDKVNLDDMLMSKPGGVVRVEQGASPGNEIFPMAVPFIFPQAMEAMEYLDQIRENRTGTSRYFTGIDQNSLNKTASGIAQLTSSAGQRVESIARTFAYGIEYLFSIAHEVILKHGRKKDVVRLRNKWVDVDPSQWRSRTDVKATVGVGAGSKEQLVAQLQGIVQRQMEVIPLGITDPERIYNSMAEMTKLTGFANPDKFWKDPTVNPPPPPQPNPEILLKQQELQQKAQADQQDSQLEAMELQLKEKIAAMEAQLQREKMALELQLEQQRMAHQKEVDTIKLAMEAQSHSHDHDFKTRDMALKETADSKQKNAASKDELDEHRNFTSAIAAALDNHMQGLNGKRTFAIERGADGKASRAVVAHADGSQKEIKLLRDKNKRLIGGEINTIQ